MIKDSRRSENIGIMSKRQKGVLIELTYKLHSQIREFLSYRYFLIKIAPAEYKTHRRDL